MVNPASLPRQASFCNAFRVSADKRFSFPTIRSTTLGRNKFLMKLVDDRGLADAGVSGNQHKLRPAAGDDTVEGGKQGIDLGCPTIQFLGDQQPVRSVVFPGRECVDIASGFPFSKATP